MSGFQPFQQINSSSLIIALHFSTNVSDKKERIGYHKLEMFYSHTHLERKIQEKNKTSVKFIIIQLCATV